MFTLFWIFHYLIVSICFSMYSLFQFMLDFLNFCKIGRIESFNTASTKKNLHDFSLSKQKSFVYKTGKK